MKETKLHKQESRQILRLAQEYRKKGYEVTISPTRIQLPHFPSSHTPDSLQWVTMKR